MATKFDVTDGGIPTVFLDGPKKGQKGVVTPSAHGQPPDRLEFGEGNHTVYLRHRPQVFTTKDPISGKRRRLTGVTYRMDPDCPMGREVRAIIIEEQVRRGQEVNQ